MKLLLLALAALLLCGGAAAAPAVDEAPAAARATVAPAPARSVFSGNGVLVAIAGNVDPRWLGDELRAAHADWVAVEIADGARPVNTAALESGWLDRLRERGIAVGGWSVLRDDPVADAAAAASSEARYRLGFYIADAEFSYGRLGDPSRSAQFVAAFAAAAPPGLPRALSSFGRVDGDYGFDWAAWSRAGYEYLPQSYTVDGAAFAPPLSVAAGLRYWPRAEIHPTLGSYGGVTLASYSQAGLGEGFSVFPGETLQTGDFAQFAQLAR